jgi:hypothetical protein
MILFSWVQNCGCEICGKEWKLLCSHNFPNLSLMFKIVLWKVICTHFTYHKYQGFFFVKWRRSNGSECGAWPWHLSTVVIISSFSSVARCRACQCYILVSQCFYFPFTIPKELSFFFRIILKSCICLFPDKATKVCIRLGLIFWAIARMNCQLSSVGCWYFDMRSDRIAEPEKQPLLGNGGVNKQQYQSHC